MTIAVSIIIPAYNRIEPLRHTLSSAVRAADWLCEAVEILLIDDGSSPSLDQIFANTPFDARIRIIRQPNQGSIVARMTGLSAARGEFILFLDSDDLISPAKLLKHVERLRKDTADISYDDMGPPTRGDAIPKESSVHTTLATVNTVEELLLTVQPAPHSPIYRRSYLLQALAKPLLPPLRECDAVGDIWLYYNLCIHPAKVVKINAPLTLPGQHGETRYSQHWERLGYASLGVMESFQQHCPVTSATQAARRLLGECAFISWRRLPRGFDATYSQQLLALWRAAPEHEKMNLGGPLFRALALFLGPVGAGKLLRLRNANYSEIRTVDDAELIRLRDKHISLSKRE